MAIRTKILFGFLLIALSVRLGWGWFSDRGLITVHADQQPLSAVTRSIEKQAGIRLLANFDGASRVTMHVNKVPLGEALETLSAVTDSQWELTYIAAPNRSKALGLLAQFGSGNRSEDWVRLRKPMPRGLDSEEEEIPLDPRRDRWEIKTVPEANLKSYLDQASADVNATFMLPKDWNPAVSSTPSPGEIATLAPKLIKKAGGETIEAFLLVKRGDRGDREEGGRGRPDVASGNTGGNESRGGRREGGGRPPGDPAKMEERMEAQIAKLPTAEQPAARAKMEERRKFWESIRDLPEEERRAQMLEHFSDPTVQSRMDERRASRESRQSPEQRRDRYERYAQRKAQAIGGQ